MIVHISQPRLYPHLSYLEKVFSADLFVVLDDLPIKPELFERRNRYFNSSAMASRWLTVPTSKGEEFRHTRILDLDFAAKHRRILYDNYLRAPHFDDSLLMFLVPDPVGDSFLDYYMDSIRRVSDVLLPGSCLPRIGFSSSAGSCNTGVQRLNDILSYYNADVYLSGSAGAEYIHGNCIVPVTFRDHRDEVSRFHTNPLCDDMLMYIDTIFNCGVEFTRGLLK
ncbi:MAG: WbqC family protein [Victivallaceae bacterium]